MDFIEGGGKLTLLWTYFIMKKKRVFILLLARHSKLLRHLSKNVETSRSAADYPPAVSRDSVGRLFFWEEV